MLSQDKKKIAYYAGLSILFGSVELFIPKLLPFFRLGLANIPLLLALGFDFKSFMLLALLKAIGNSYISGNLFSFFVIVSISQSLASAAVMYGANKTRLFSRYGISLLGALASSFVQISVASLYVGNSVFAFLPVMLIISLLSSMLVAFLSYKLNKLEPATLAETKKEEESSLSAILIAEILLSALAIVLIDKPLLSLIAFIAALVTQKAVGRRIMLLPHLGLLAAMLLCSLLTPEGKIIAELGGLKITEGALQSGAIKALRLSGTIAISQAYSSYLRPANNLLGESLRYFTLLFSAFKKTEGNLGQRVTRTLELKTIEEPESERKKTPNALFSASTLSLLSLAIINYLI